MKFTIPADDKIADLILETKKIDLITRFKLVYIHTLGNEKQKRLVKKIILRYSNNEIDDINSKRVMSRINDIYKEIKTKHDENEKTI